MPYSLARSLLFSLAPETAHAVALRSLDVAATFGARHWLTSSVNDRPVEAMGLRFPNAVGLAAGLDKNGAHVDGLAACGFGFIEVGTVTPRAQSGNPLPRLFRLPEANAIINRMGFNNLGVDALIDSVQRRAYRGPLGINIGKNADTPVENALDDYLIGLRKVYAYADYVTVNISSPNTRGLRSLQMGEPLRVLLAGLSEERERLADQHGRRVPIAVKIAPDLDDDELPKIADTIQQQKMDAIIATNTTLARDKVVNLPHAQETGGLSGVPVFERSTEVVRVLAQHLKGALPIIGVGGIFSGNDALAKLQAGASLIQIYTGFIYRGPALVTECRRAIADSSLAK